MLHCNFRCGWDRRCRLPEARCTLSPYSQRRSLPSKGHRDLYRDGVLGVTALWVTLISERQIGVVFETDQTAAPETSNENARQIGAEITPCAIRCSGLRAALDVMPCDIVLLDPKLNARLRSVEIESSDRRNRTCGDRTRRGCMGIAAPLPFPAYSRRIWLTIGLRGEFRRFTTGSVTLRLRPGGGSE